MPLSEPANLSYSQPLASLFWGSTNSVALNWLQFSNKKLPLAPNLSRSWTNCYNFISIFCQSLQFAQKGNLRPSLLALSTLIRSKKIAKATLKKENWKSHFENFFLFSLKECSSLWASVGLLSLVSCSPAPQQKIFAKLTLLHQFF